MSYRIGSFNMYKFSLQSDEEIRKSMDTICQIINDNFDIVAIQEIFTPAALKYQLLRNLGSQWDGRWGQPLTGSPQAAEGYAFIWNKRIFQLAKDKDRYGNDIIVEPDIIENYHTIPGYTRLLRAPFYGRFIPKRGPFFELRLINTHVRFSASSSDDESEETSASMIQLRRNEVETLIKQICDKKGTEHTGNNRSAYTFLLGDYNLNLKKGMNPYPYVPEYYEIIDGSSTKYYRTVQEEKTTLRQQKNEVDILPDKYANNYDHFTYDESRLVDALGIDLRAYRIDTLEIYAEGDVAKHKFEISDHVPIRLDMSL